MTKAVILSNKGKGLYSARIEYDTDRLEDRIAFIQAAISATDDLIAELEEALAQVESDRDDAGQALRDAIAAYEQAKIDMELEKEQARLDAAAVRDQVIAAANGSHDSTVDRVDDDIQAASSERQSAIAAANDQYAIAEAEYQQGMDDADHDFAVCVDSGTDYATCRDTRDEEYERLDAALQDAADRRDDAIASADDTYDSAYERGQKTIEASEATRDAAIDKAEAAYVQTLANIDGDFKALEAPMQAVTEANLEYIKTLQPVQNAESQIGMQEINRLSAEQQLAVLQAAREERIEDVWCADYTLNLQPDDEAGLIWPDIDANKLPIVMPGGRPAEYQARVASEHVMGPASSFFNRAIMPILQRIKPRHKIGKVTAVNEDGTLNVELRADLSRFGRVNTVIKSGLSSVPVEYMNYGALPFEVGDDVVVRFDGIDQTDPVVIGFEHDPKMAHGIVANGYQSTSYAISASGAIKSVPGRVGNLSDNLTWQGENGDIISWRIDDPYDTLFSRMGFYSYISHIIPGEKKTIAAPGLVIGAAIRKDLYLCATCENISRSEDTVTIYSKPVDGGDWSALTSVSGVLRHRIPAYNVDYSGVHEFSYPFHFSPDGTIGRGCGLELKGNSLSLMDPPSVPFRYPSGRDAFHAVHYESTLSFCNSARVEDRPVWGRVSLNREHFVLYNGEVVHYYHISPGGEPIVAGMSDRAIGSIEVPVFIQYNYAAYGGAVYENGITYINGEKHHYDYPDEFVSMDMAVLRTEYGFKFLGVVRKEYEGRAPVFFIYSDPELKPNFRPDNYFNFRLFA